MWEDGNGYSADYDFNFLFATAVGILQKVNLEEICALLLLFFFMMGQKCSLAVLFTQERSSST